MKGIAVCSHSYAMGRHCPSLASLTGPCVCGRYAKTDAASLAYLRRELLRPHYTAVEVGVGVTVAASVVGGL